MRHGTSASTLGLVMNAITTRKPLLIVSADPLNPRRPDAHFVAEADAAARAGFEIALFSYEQLHAGDASRAIRQIAPSSGPIALLRSWMLRVEHYAELFDALLRKGVRLINAPAAYRICHELPSAYVWIAGHTPATVWVAREQIADTESIVAALRPFGDRPVILKDFVKSLAHAWAEACFIPAASDRAAIERVVARFLALRGDDLQGGLVFRAYEPFAQAAAPVSSRPVVREYRRYVLDGQVIETVPYWDGADGHEPLPPAELFADVLAQIPSRFFTIDMAQRDDSVWRIIELGDGQVAGLLPLIDVHRFYRSVHQALQEHADG
jgi:ATP-grasp domain, R2K clade family 3